MGSSFSPPRLQIGQEGAAAAAALLDSCPSIKPHMGVEDHFTWALQIVYSQRQALTPGIPYLTHQYVCCPGQNEHLPGGHLSKAVGSGHAVARQAGSLPPSSQLLSPRAPQEGSVLSQSLVSLTL